jgi:glycosyltransferase involved in cell wall biosynthesis
MTISRERRRGHILFVIGCLNVGGAESQLVLLAEQLNLRGWRVEVFALDATGPLADRLHARGIQVIDGRYKSDRGSKIAKLAALGRAQLRLFLHIVRAKPEIVHSFLPLTNFLAAVNARLTFTPLVITSKRALGNHQDSSSVFKYLDRIANSLSHAVTSNSLAVALDTEQRDGYPASKIVVIPNGVDFARATSSRNRRERERKKLGLADSDIAIGKVANLIPYKGHFDLIEAFANVVRDDPRPKLFLIGQDRGIGDLLCTRIKELGLIDRIKLLGQRNDAPELLSAMDIGVIASHEEGFSNALLEMLAAGLPVIATNVGGNPEAVRDLEGAMLVPPKNAPEMAKAILRTIEKLDAGTLRLESHLVIKRFSISRMVTSHEDLYLMGPMVIEDRTARDGVPDRAGEL